MVYECEYCEGVLGPGLTACPWCGQVFDEAVPDDAQRAGPVPAAASDGVGGQPLLKDAAAPEAVTSPGPRKRSRDWSPSAVSLVLLGLCWLGYRHWDAPPAPEPVLTPATDSLTDLAAHPQYAAHMAALVQKLRATGVRAEWPAFGSDDVLLITPQARVAEPPVAWDADTDRRLAQGVYGEFAQTRFESGFPDGDTTACFVLVTGASGNVMAGDFMGRVE